jgi:hypothetical protein
LVVLLVSEVLEVSEVPVEPAVVLSEVPPALAVVSPVSDVFEPLVPAVPLELVSVLLLPLAVDPEPDVPLMSPPL